ncbi:hypothetical protein [Roseibium sp. SCP14]|uniref:hypothetical protein n=1 Tax=Roseibium sp. SCP14 TaxID=3141375 RepID=UPI0033389EE6
MNNLGEEKDIPGFRVLDVAKVALEALVQYPAHDLEQSIVVVWANKAAIDLTMTRVSADFCQPNLPRRACYRCLEKSLR